jgi:UDP-2-acetamido-3-amino-2,3-dideoxy-glucuronate N-acetyltransferase
MSEFGHRLEFDKSNEAICLESNEVYILKNNAVRKK